MLYQYGVEVIPLGEYVKKFCLKQGNLKLTNFLKYLTYAQDIWQELFRKTIWDIKQVGIKIENGRIQLPSDCERLLNLSIVDRHNRIQPLGFNPNINTTQMKCLKTTCSCNRCNGENTLCGVLDNITMTTTQVNIGGTDYPAYTWIRYDNCGNIQQSVNAPFWDVENKEVVYRQSISVLCQVEVTETGCIKNTPQNVAMMQQYCGYTTPYAQDGLGWYGGLYNRRDIPVIPENYNYFGEWNYNAADRSIIEVKIWQNAPISGTISQTVNNQVTTYTPYITANPEQVNVILVTYRTNGLVPDQELLIPQYANFAMDSGILWYVDRFNPLVRDGGLRKEITYKAHKRELFAYLNPVRIEEVAKTQTNLKRW